MMTDTRTSTTRRRARLERPAKGKLIAGVAAGIGNHYNVAPGWVRVGFLVLALFGGLGVVLYLVGWLAIPEEGRRESIVGRYLGSIDGAPSWLGAALIGIGVLIILGAGGVVRGDLLFAGALVLIGILLYRGELTSPRRGAPTTEEQPIEDFPEEDIPDGEAGDEPSVPGVPFLESEPVETEVAGEYYDAGSPPGAPPPEPAEVMPPPLPPPPRPRSILGPVTLGVLLLALGVVAVLDLAGVVFPSFHHYVAIVVLVSGVGLVVGSWFGRARALIALGLILTPVLLVASLVSVPLDGGFGDPLFRPGSVESVQDEYELTAGQLTIDLRNVDPGEGSVSFDTSLGFGETILILPGDVGAVVDAHVGIGQISLSRNLQMREENGFGVDTTVSVEGPGLIEVDAEVGVGRLEIIRLEGSN